MRLSVERYHGMIEHGILGKYDKIELLRGIIVPKYAPYPAASDYPNDAYPLPIMPLSVERYHAMIEHGILGADDRVELLRGLLVLKTRKSPSHRIAKWKLLHRIERFLPANWFADTQNPITLADSEPEPDFFITRGDITDYRDGHPAPKDLALVAEIADSSLSRDRIFKRDLYAANGIANYWIVNLPDNRIEVYSQTSGGVYQESRFYSSEEPVPVVVEGKRIGSVRFADLTT